MFVHINEISFDNTQYTISFVNFLWNMISEHKIGVRLASVQQSSCATFGQMCSACPNVLQIWPKAQHSTKGAVYMQLQQCTYAYTTAYTTLDIQDLANHTVQLTNHVPNKKWKYNKDRRAVAFEVVLTTRPGTWLGDWAPTLRGEGTSMLIETTRVETPSSSSISKINIPTYCHVKNATHGPAPVKKRSETSTVRPWTGQSRSSIWTRSNSWCLSMCQRGAASSRWSQRLVSRTTVCTMYTHSCMNPEIL